MMTAVNVARMSKHPRHLILINGKRPLGRGVAYGTRRPEHLLNVAARNMSAFPDLSDHFLQWLRTRSEFDTVSDLELRERFMPRMVFGDYLKSLMHHHLQGVEEDAKVTAEFIDGVAVDVEVNGSSGVVLLEDGSRIDADRVVLASGNEPPAALPGSDLLQDHPGWAGNPWLPWHENLPGDEGTIVILGTGLTTVDSIISLRAMGWLGRIHAVSRHGWLPEAHFRGIDYPDFPPPDVVLAELGLEKLRALLEEHCAKLRERGANPAIVVDKMRPHTQQVWKNFSNEERLTFARRDAARWNIMRHRIAPEIHAQVTGSQLTGQLQVHSANIVGVEAEGGKVKVNLEGKPSLTGDLVINATGPQTRFSASKSILLGKLLERGLISPDEMDMGIRIAEDHTVVTKDGNESEVLLALGPLLRGTLWETIAVPELRGQASRVAATLVGGPVAPAEDLSALVEFII